MSWLSDPQVAEWSRNRVPIHDTLLACFPQRNSWTVKDVIETLAHRMGGRGDSTATKLFLYGLYDKAAEWADRGDLIRTEHDAERLIAGALRAARVAGWPDVFADFDYEAELPVDEATSTITLDSMALAFGAHLAPRGLRFFGRSQLPDGAQP